MVHAAAVHEHRAAGHLGGHGVGRVERAQAISITPVAAGHDARRAVRLGEVGERPDGVELHVVALGEREEVERPLVAVDRLRRLAAADGDGLGEVDVERRRPLEQPGGGGEDQRVLQQLPRSGAARRERAGATGRPAGEVLDPERRGCEPRGQLRLEAVEHIAGRKVVDDHPAVGPEGRDDVVSGGGR